MPNLLHPDVLKIAAFGRQLARQILVSMAATTCVGVITGAPAETSSQAFPTEGAQQAPIFGAMPAALTFGRGARSSTNSGANQIGLPASRHFEPRRRGERGLRPLITAAGSNHHSRGPLPHRPSVAAAAADAAVQSEAI